MREPLLALFSDRTQATRAGGEDVLGEVTGEGRVCVAASYTQKVICTVLALFCNSLML